MKHLCSVLGLALALWLGIAAAAQQEDRRPVRLPSGKTQREEILKADYEKSLREAAELVKMAEDLKIELEKNERHVLSVAALKKTEEIEKLARRIRDRLKRF